MDELGKVSVTSNNPALAAIKYAIEHQCDEPIAFLRCWYEGNFNAIRREWDNVPDEVFVGADPTLEDVKLFDRKGNGLELNDFKFVEPSPNSNMVTSK